MSKKIEISAKIEKEVIAPEENKTPETEKEEALNEKKAVSRAEPETSPEPEPEAQMEGEPAPEEGKPKPEGKLADKAEEAKLEKELEEVIEKIPGGKKVAKTKLGAKLAALLQNEIKEYKKKEKTRAAEMIAIFAAHNFYSNGLTPLELRTTLEDLGPTYVKIGQIMSSRPDLLPKSYCKELEKLRQTVKPLPAEIARAVIEDEVGKPIDEIYSEFRDEPLGSASIGQAHYAVLKDGTRVVTKVQRPLIEEMMMKDFALLRKLAKLVNIVTDSGDKEQVIDLISVIDELERVSVDELDFRVEAENTKFFKENCIENEDEVSCPTVIDELTTKRIFTMTFVDGCSISKRDRLVSEGVDIEAVGAALVNNYVHQVLDVGVFHADPHQGNIMVSHGKPYWIDFGMIGRIGKREIDQLQTIILAILDQDTDSLVNCIMAMGATSAQTNVDKLSLDADAFLSRLGGVNSLEGLNVSELLSEVMDLAAKHHVSLPPAYTLLARSVLAIEGVIEHFCPELNLLELISKKLIQRARENFDLKKSLIDAGKGLLGTTKKAAKIPALASDVLKGLSKGKTKMNMEITGLDSTTDRLANIFRYLAMTFVACVLFISGCILCTVPNLQPSTSIGIPLLSLIIMIFSVALGIFSVLKIGSTRKK